MRNPSFIKNITRLGAALAVAGSVLAAKGQTQVYFQDFVTDDTANWTVNQTIGNHSAEFFFDYSTVGIPLSPHSTNSTTTAMRLRANFGPDAGAAAGSGLSVSPTGFSITENFEMHFDMWLNFNGPFPGGGSGSTLIGGGGFGTAGTTTQTAGVADSVYVSTSCDGGSSADYRVYTPSAQASFPDGSPVYVNVLTRNGSQAYYVTNFPPQTVPLAQLALYPQQTNTTGGPSEPGMTSSSQGVAGFKWRDVLLSKVANIITYKIDDVTIAVLDLSTNGTLGGNNILFNYFDINATISSDPNFTNLNFALYDNIRITNFAGVVSVTAPTPAAAEAGPTAAVFTIGRTDPGPAITVNYSIGGTAVNGVDYTNQLGGALSGTIELGASQLSTNITIIPVDDTIPELTETIILSVLPGVGYFGSGNALATIADNEQPQLTITNVSTQMYERTNDYATFKITRLGDTNTASFNANLAFSGSATLGVDYYTNTVVTLDPGVATTNYNVYPIVDTAYEGSESVTVDIAPAGGPAYTVGSPSSASITLVDANGPTEIIQFQDNFDADHTANWTQYFVANDGTPDSNVDFNFPYTSFGIPAAPHGGGNGLWMNVNKIAPASAAALNFYPNGQNFSGNFALRFDMFLSVPLPNGSATEFCLAGINHTGTKTNWWRSGGVPAGAAFDGLFAAIETDGQSAPSYALYSSPTVANNPTLLTSQTPTAVATAFKSPPWGVVGTPANGNAPSGVFATPAWTDVELTQVGSIVTLKINNTVTYSYSNTTAFTSGNIMLGYNDAFDSVSPEQSYVVIDNVRVVTVTGLNITAIQDLGTDVQIDFTFGLSDVPSAFKAQSASVVTGTYLDTAATIVQITPGTYRATVAKAGDAQFYRIRHQ